MHEFLRYGRALADDPWLEAASIRRDVALANADPAEADWSSPPTTRQLALRSDSATKNWENMSLTCNNELAHVA